MLRFETVLTGNTRLHKKIEHRVWPFANTSLGGRFSDLADTPGHSCIEGGQVHDPPILRPIVLLQNVPDGTVVPEDEIPACQSWIYT